MNRTDNGTRTYARRFATSLATASCLLAVSILPAPDSNTAQHTAHNTAHNTAQGVLDAALTSAQNLAQPRAWAHPEGTSGGHHIDPNLVQTVRDDEKIIPPGTKHAFTRGHADIGVRMSTAQNAHGLSLLIRDDAQESPVWRELDDVVFVLGDNAQQALPEDGSYGFTGAKGGQKVWVVPQSEVQGVPWFGWSTQSPGLIEKVNQGVNMDFLGHQGPGQFTMFLQSGGFAAPEVLWDSSKAAPQSMWVESNTHAHSNWIFTEPGVHLVKVRVRATLVTKDGSKPEEVSVTKVLRFAVGGESTSDVAQGRNAQALAAQWDASKEQAGGEQKPAGKHGADSSAVKSAEEDGGVNIVLIAIVGIVVLLLAVLVGFGLKFRKESALMREEMAEHDTK